METQELSPADSKPTAAAPESVEEILQSDDVPLSTKRELRKILREDSNWSLRSITITALTGVSAAVIATQLNGIVSSMVLIAIMAFITASVSEIYRVFLALTGFGAKKAAAKAAKVLPLTAAEQRAAQEASETDPVTEALEVVTSAYRLSEEQEAKHPGILRRISYRLKNYGKANPFLWLVVLFLGIAITTVSVAYLVTDGQPPQIIQRTVVATEEIAAEDRAAIVAEAKEQALEELRADEPTSRVTTVPDQSTVDELSGMGDRLSAMETEIGELGAAQPTPSPTLPDQTLLDRIAKLEAERDALTKRIEELEAKVAAGSSGSPVATSNSPSASGPTATR